jgi:hypothetical protein
VNGYEIPAQIDGYDEADFVCVSFRFPNTPEYRRAVRSQLLELGSWWSWERDGTTRARDTAIYFRSLLLSLAIGDICGGTEPDDDDAPYWDDAETVAGVGEGSRWEYIGDWAVTAFLAAAGSPGAALLYRTLVNRARLAFKSDDLGGIADIFIDGILALTIDTITQTPGIAEIIEADIDLVQFAIDHSLPPGERVIRIERRAA